MRSTRCIFNTAAALHRVFIAPAEFPRCSHPLPRPNPFSRILLPTQRRAFVNLKQAEKSRLPRDDEIKAWSITLVKEDGTLSEPRPTREILEGIDRKKDTLVVVKPGEPGVPPVCKIQNKIEMREREKAIRKAERKGGPTVKNIELNWAIDGNDLGHRLTKMKMFLAKGQKVEVLLASKRKGKGRKATEEEAKAVLEKIRDAMREVAGAKEAKPAEGKLLATLTIFMEGKLPKGGKEVGSKGEPTVEPVKAQAATAA